jgi:hypothetical protein
MQRSQPSPPPTTYASKSRGKLILAFGIISLLLVPLCGVLAYILRNEFAVFILMFSFLIAVTLGISASVMAAGELRKIREGILAVSARGLTKTGRILGLIGAVVYPLVFCALLQYLFSSPPASSPKDSINNDLANLAATAYQYRIRPDSVGGGGGSYMGFVIPARMSRNENAVYTATVIHADTIQFYAKWVVDSTSTITVRMDADGQLRHTWTYTGDFQ